MDLNNQVKIVLSSKDWSRKYGLSSITSWHLCILQKVQVILTCVDDCVIVSHKQELIISLIYSLNNGIEECVLTYKGFKSNYLRFNIKKDSDCTFELSQLHLV